MSANRRQFLSYAGKRIIFHDYSNLSGSEFTRVLEEIARDADTDKETGRLVLMNLSNTVIDKAVMKAFRKMTGRASETVERGAVYGLSSMQSLFMSIIQKVVTSPVKAFGTKEAALEWLVSGD